MIAFREAARTLLAAVFRADAGSEGRTTDRPLTDRQAARIAGLSLCARCRLRVRAVPRPDGRDPDLVEPGIAYRAEVEAVCSTLPGRSYRDWGQDRVAQLWDDTWPTRDVPHDCPAERRGDGRED